MTDVLGVMTAWESTTTTVQPEAGEPVVIALADIVSGKPVPPRPSVRLRVTAQEAERRALEGWPAVVSEPLGEWVLRASAGFTSRANSVLAVGSPRLPLDAALDRVTAFYTAHRLPAWAQVVVGSDAHMALESAGWAAARPREADTRFQVASVAQVARAVRGLVHSGLSSAGGAVSGAVSVSVSPDASDAWLAVDARALVDPVAARTVLEAPAQVAFVSVTGTGGELVAKGRVSHCDDWAGITDVWVARDHRRQGLALVVMAALVDWSAEQGARTAYLQTRGDNPGALALYDQIGFVTHHEYRYLAAP